jgi:hypothetical protein
MLTTHFLQQEAPYSLGWGPSVLMRRWAGWGLWFSWQRCIAEHLPLFSMHGPAQVIEPKICRLRSV